MNVLCWICWYFSGQWDYKLQTWTLAMFTLAMSFSTVLHLHGHGPASTVSLCSADTTTGLFKNKQVQSEGIKTTDFHANRARLPWTELWTIFSWLGPGSTLPVVDKQTLEDFKRAFWCCSFTPWPACSQKVQSYSLSFIINSSLLYET